MIAILDYGLGNVRSVQKALERVGYPATLISEPAEMSQADRIILPGVGNFADGMRLLTGGGWDDAIRDFAATGRPVLGVCMGMQFLLTSSEEEAPRGGPAVPGLGLIPGEVVAFMPPGEVDDPRYKVPHMGWNTVAVETDIGGAFAEALRDRDFYFVHGYVCCPERASDRVGTTTHGRPFCSALRHENLLATQFHPEKSQSAGLEILNVFAQWSA